MAAEAKSRVTDLAQVRIPAKLHESLCSFFSELKLRVLHAAVRQAAARTTDDLAAVVNEEDLLQAARPALATAFRELEAALQQPETAHARQAS